ncbi:MAG: Asp-tRNA(Asn)/Glu-tRNA(Gln) amidotransferase subunit GatA [Bacteroidota bacterium]|nr:Asp-tRNA(Asn)/Glu-tRNA(Gln) amidotransferase subunit GatA [Bacteroidota bacterium]MDP4195475.1 Asp-tRNA(Asn)/Glu-tRNA(Gln) amidotransferase subunit GatA [Bacteroidota bacterium]
MLNYKNHQEKLEKIKSGEISLSENVKHFLKNIEANKKLNAFNFVFSEDALKDAELIETKIKSSSSCGKLAGMVIAIKDVLALKDKPLTCSSKILKDFVSLYNATAINKLKEQDAIIIGKTSCDEFAMGSSNENSAFGPVLNPVDPSRVPGGSSGGSAVAVASECCDAALGTDTGGSIRQPAAFCGVFGLKPTYGRVSRFGLTAFASSFDSIGPFTNNVEDASLILEVISGKDCLDSTSADIPVPDFQKLLDDVNLASGDYNGKPRIGIPKEYFGHGLNPEIRESIENLIGKLKTSGFEVKEISLPHTEYSIATYYILTTAEASSNLARYDGARYGYRSSESHNLKQMYTLSRSEGFGKEVKRRIMLGTYVLSAGYYDAYYKKAQKVRRLLKNDFDNAFSEVDLILTPTTPSTAFKIGEKSSDPLEMYLNDIYTTSANLAGIPGINIPIATSSEGLPIGLQLMANQFNETALLKMSYYIQKNLL